MAYPTDLQDLNAGIGASGDPLSLPNHIDQHTAEASVIESLEAKVGIDSSTVKTTIDYKLSGIPTDDKAVSLTGTEDLTNKSLKTGTKITLGSDATGDIYYRHSDGTLKRLAVSTDGKILRLASGIPAWDTETSVVDASTTAKGVVEEATLAQIDANTAAGETSARLFVNPSTLGKSIDGTLADNSDAKIPSQKAVKTYVDLQDATDLQLAKDYTLSLSTTVASANQRFIDNTNVTITGGSYALCKEIKLNENLPGARITWTVTITTGTQTVKTKVYKNGVAVGTEQTDTSNASHSEDLTGLLKDDLIQIYGYIYSGTGDHYVDSMSISFDRTLITGFITNPTATH